MKSAEYYLKDGSDGWVQCCSVDFVVDNHMKASARSGLPHYRPIKYSCCGAARIGWRRTSIPVSGQWSVVSQLDALVR